MAKTKHVLVVMSNAAPGRDKEYNDWYTNQHVPDVLNVPGIVSAQRFKLDKTQRPGNPPAKWGYCALYNFDTENLEATLSEIAKRSRTPAMPVPNDIVDTWAYVYTPITPLVEK